MFVRFATIKALFSLK